MSATILRFSDEVCQAIRSIKAIERELERARGDAIPEWGREWMKARERFLTIVNNKQLSDSNIVTLSVLLRKWPHALPRQD